MVVHKLQVPDLDRRWSLRKHLFFKLFFFGPFFLKTGLNRGKFLILEIKHLLAEFEISLALTNGALVFELARDQLTFCLGNGSLIQFMCSSC